MSIFLRNAKCPLIKFEQSTFIISWPYISFTQFKPIGTIYGEHKDNKYLKTVSYIV